MTPLRPNPRPLNLAFHSILCAIFVLAGCSAEEEKKANGSRGFFIPVELGSVSYRDRDDPLTTVGNLQATQTVSIAPEVAGKIVKMSVREGSQVKAGDPLFLIDPEKFQLERERARLEMLTAEHELEKEKAGLREEDRRRLEADKRAAESALELSLKELDRVKTLVSKGVVARSELDKAEDQTRQQAEALKISVAAVSASQRSREESIAQAQAALDIKRENLLIAELNLKKTDVRAPYAGVVISRQGEIGTVASTSTPVIKMAGVNVFTAVFQLPEKYRGKLSALKSVDFWIKEIDFKFRLDEDLDRLVRVIPASDIYSGSIWILVGLKKPAQELFPGLTFEATLHFKTRKNVLHVPSTALAITEQGSLLYVVKEGKAHPVPVRALKEQNGFVEVVDFTRQLTPKTELIVRGAGSVFPGASVMVSGA
ncbi:MAG: biotin/lipoyl-binding protein [Candidatus Nitrohelix vancouverensis]|uniref:Biotin/lipoyl-binding protein n=1 Tax=Candidatus Nitrohelix vancouverensis TaxID=2705534 RepID=A0A7T0G2G4_9BACT|nr:MAG: biotin/lipoyl-binding protein [Candidatus Nitrohelix vancouverensis]